MGASDQASIRAVLGGDRDAYRRLVVQHSPMLFRLAYRITGNEADADDVVQDAFLRGYLKLETFAGRADFGTWIYRIAVHCALDKLRQRKAERAASETHEPDDEPGELMVADPAPGPESIVLSAELAAMQEMAMRGLTAVERTAFVLRHHEEKSIDEIASTLKVAPNAAKQTVFRAVQKVRRRLETLKVTV